MTTLRDWSNGRSKWNRWSAAVGLLASIGLLIGASNEIWQLVGVGLAVLNAFCFWKSYNAG